MITKQNSIQSDNHQAEVSLHYKNTLHGLAATLTYLREAQNAQPKHVTPGVPIQHSINNHAHYSFGFSIHAVKPHPLS
jgi:predicted porin